MTRGEIKIEDNTGKQTCSASTAGLAERWVYWVDQANGNAQRTQNFQFTTPVTAPADQKCGKVVFSDMHVSGDSDSSTGTAFPGQCSSAGLTPQEKALAFMLFDLSSCVGVLL